MICSAVVPNCARAVDKAKLDGMGTFSLADAANRLRCLNNMGPLEGCLPGVTRRYRAVTRCDRLARRISSKRGFMATGRVVGGEVQGDLSCGRGRSDAGTAGLARAGGDLGKAAGIIASKGELKSMTQPASSPLMDADQTGHVGYIGSVGDGAELLTRAFR